MTLYVETSAVLAWLLGEQDGEAVRKTIDRADTVVSSTLTLLETERSLSRAVSTGIMTEADRAVLRGMFARQHSGWELMEITPAVRSRAQNAFPVEPVRSLDPIHLATALAFAEAFGPITVISFDERIAQNLTPLGLLDPR